MRITEFSIEFTSPSGAYRNGAAQADLNADRIEAVSLLGALMPPGDSQSTASLLRQVCNRAADDIPIASRMNIKSNIIDDVPLAPAQSARLGLIASELLANAVAHAHPAGVYGAAELSYQREGSNVLLEVSDDGVGLPEGFDPARDASRGLRIVRAIAEDLGATVRFNSGGCGLQVQVFVPQPL